MVPSIDDKALATDTTPFSQAFVREGKHRSFLDSPITKGLTAKDICIYNPGDLNKVGKEGKTSWDSFSYAIQMGHNVWSLLMQCKKQIDNTTKESSTMLVEEFLTGYYSRCCGGNIPTDNRDEANAVIEEFSKFWMSIIGTRGATGKKTVNASTQFANLFEEV